MAIIRLSRRAKKELVALQFNEDRIAVTRAISTLENNSYRKQHKIDFCLIEEKHPIWAVLVDYVWLAFYEESGSDVIVIHLSLLSRFRRHENKE